VRVGAGRRILEIHSSAAPAAAPPQAGPLTGPHEPKGRAMPQKPRTVSPSDAQDERLAALPLPAAFTYVYLPTVLDDEGRAKDQPTVLNGYLWPLRADTHPTDAMVADLDALVAAGLLCRYEVTGLRYLHDPRFKARHKVARPVPSTLPPCPTHDRSFEEGVSETLGRFAEQVNAFVGSAAGRMGVIDETKVRDTFARVVEDVTYLVDPEKAAAYGQKVRGLFGKVGFGSGDGGTFGWSGGTFPSGAGKPESAGSTDGAPGDGATGGDEETGGPGKTL
jgi:hypothetical protein